MTPFVVHVASGREWRGGQRQVWLLARQLAREGVDQVVVTGKNTELARRLGEAGVRVRATSWTIGLDPRVIPPILDELRRRPALLHAHDAHALSLAGTCAALTGAPFVVTRRVVFPLRWKHFWRRASCVIAISAAVRNALVQDGIPRSRIAVVPSAVDLDGMAGSTEALDIRTRLGLPKKGQVSVSLGALTAEKDHDTLLQAAARLVRDLPGLHWVIVGEGPLRPALLRTIARLGLGDRVHLIGHLADPHEALAGADVFVLSSISEGLGSSVLAAMACAVPVVATSVGGVAELLGSGAGALVPARDPVQLADAVRRVLRDPEHVAALRQSARITLARFRVDAMAEQVLEVYRSCAHYLERS